MKKEIQELAIQEAGILVSTQCTVRQVANIMGNSKTSVHYRMKHILPSVDKELSLKVEEILQRNKAERHIRGGLATRKKYLRLGQMKNII